MEGLRQSSAHSVLAPAAALLVGLASLILIWLLARPLALLLLAITLAQALSPLVVRLERYASRTVAVWFIYLALFVAVGAGIALALPAVLEEARQLVDGAPDLIGQLRGGLGDWTQALGGGARDTLLKAAGNVTTALVAVPMAAVTVLFEALVVVFLSLYFLVSGPRLHAFVLSLLPPRKRRRAARVLSRMGHTMGGYVRGVAINAVIIGSLTGAGLMIIGIDYTLVLAVLAALGETCPTSGHWRRRCRLSSWHFRTPPRRRSGCAGSIWSSSNSRTIWWSPG